MPALDHIVILVPRPKLLSLPSWITESFTVIDGGQHAGGITENKLILLQDGVYLELIAFIGGTDDDESRRLSHRWGKEPDGHIIDWALSLPSGGSTPDDIDTEFRSIQDRVRAAGAGLGYHDLVAGGRTTPDGVILKWATSSPAFLDGDAFGASIAGGILPFWCLDRTERRLRVPYASGNVAEHPSAAIGVAGITLHIADAALLDRLRRVYDVLLSKKSDGEWDIETPEKGHGKPARLELDLLSNDSKAGVTQGWIELSLYTTGEPRVVGGSLVDGWRIDIRLDSVQ